MTSVLIGTIAGVVGTLLIKDAFGQDLEINVYTTVIDVIAQLIIAAGIASLAVAGLTGLPFILGTIILCTAAALVDFIIFNYTRVDFNRRYIC